MKEHIENDKVYGVIYIITNIVNNKKYIGVTTRENGFDGRYNASGVDIERVYKFHMRLKLKKENHNEHLLNSIEKYGFDSFKVNKSYKKAYSKEELSENEISLIAKFKTNNPKYGYNKTAGGDGFGKMSDFEVRVRKAFSDAKKINKKINTIKDRINTCILNNTPSTHTDAYILKRNGFDINDSMFKIAYKLYKGKKVKVCEICGVMHNGDGKKHCCSCVESDISKEYKLKENKVMIECIRNKIEKTNNKIRMGKIKSDIKSFKYLDF